MELFDYKEFIAHRKATAEKQAREYFYNKKERDNFCFNQLLMTNPELAARLHSRVEGAIYGCHFPVHVPFAILFDELRADAEIIQSSPHRPDQCRCRHECSRCQRLSRHDEKAEGEVLYPFSLR